MAKEPCVFAFSYRSNKSIRWSPYGYFPISIAASLFDPF